MDDQNTREPQPYRVAAELKSFNPHADAIEAAARHGYSVSMTTYFSPPEMPAGTMPSDEHAAREVDRILAGEDGRPEPDCSDRGAMAAAHVDHNKPRFELGQVVLFSFMGYVNVAGVVRSITIYDDREASYCIGPMDLTDRLPPFVTRESDELRLPFSV